MKHRITIKTKYIVEYLLLCVCVLVLLSMLALSGCGGGGNGEAPPSNDTPPVTGNLDNGGTVVGEDGVSLTAMNNTLSTPIEVSIGSAMQPAEPLPIDAMPIGQYYEVRANASLGVSNFHPFVISLPVVAGTDTTQLALAVLTSPDAKLDTETTEWSWTLLTGRYDAVNQTFRTQLNFLAADGRTYVLVEYPGFASPTMSATTQPQAFKESTSVTPRFQPGTDGTIMQAYDFFITCIGLFDSDCPETLKQAVKTKLDKASENFRALGFEEPNLSIMAPDEDPETGDLIGLGYVVYIKSSSHDDCTGKAGYYDPEASAMYLCISDPASGILKEFEPATVVHEYFHAIQYGYPNNYNVSLFEEIYQPWFIEGTATAASNSYLYEDGALMKRNGKFAYHKIDIPLTSEVNDDEYKAQDFWVYAGLKYEHVINYLIPTLIDGATIFKIRDRLFDQLGSGNPHDLYWEWVKNQAFEHSINYGDNDLEALLPCQLSTVVIDQQFTDRLGKTFYGLKLVPIIYTDQIPVIPVTHNYNIPPLSSVLIRLEISDGYPFIDSGVFVPDKGLSITGVGSDPEIRFKVYEVNEGDSCRSNADGDRYVEYKITDTDTFAYVLVSNTSFTKKQIFRFTANRVLGNS